MISVLPSQEKTFTIKSLEGSETKQIFDGTFTYRRPNIRNKSEIAKTASMLDGGALTLDEDTRALHLILAKLKHCLIATPDWWKASDSGFNLYDINVIFEVFTECQKFENEWREQVWGKPDATEEKA